MKTMTEFAGVHLRQALALYLDATRPAGAKGGAKIVVKPVGSEAPAAHEPTASADAAPVAEAAPETVTEAPAPVVDESLPVAEPAAPEAPAASEAPAMEAVAGDPAIKKRVAPIQVSEEVVAATKQKITEALKIEGDRLNLIWEAVQTLDRRKPKELIRRVIVMTLAEGEKAPQGAVKRGDHYFLAEYLPESILGRRGGRPRGQHEGRGRPGGRGGRGRGGPGGRDGKGRGGPGGRGDGRRPGGPGRGGPGGEMRADGPNGERGGGGGPGRGRRPGGGGRGPRGPQQQQTGGRPTPTPGGPKIVIKPVSKPSGGTPAGETPPSGTPSS